MHIKDHSAAMKFFRTYDNVASKGKWKEFVDEMEFESLIQEPRTMAQEPRMGLQGGQLVQPGIGRPGYGGPGSGAKKGPHPRLTSAEKKVTYYKKLLENLPEGYLDDYKANFYNTIKDGKLTHVGGAQPPSVKGSLKKGIPYMIEKYGENYGKIKDINAAIKASFQSQIESGAKMGYNIRIGQLRAVGGWYPKAPKGMETHHFLPKLGMEGTDINFASTRNTAFISKELNRKMSPYDTKLKAIQLEQIELLNEKKSGWEKRIEELNYKAKNIYEEAGKKVPGSRGYLGYSQMKVKPDGTYTVKITGVDPNKSLSGINEADEIFYKDITKENKLKVNKMSNIKVPKAIKPGGGVQLSMGFGALDDLVKSPGAKKIGTIARKTLLSDWVWPEIALGGAEYINRLQKGQTDRAKGETLKMMSLGLYDSGETEEAVLEQAKKLGYDEKDMRALENLMRYNKLGKKIKGYEEALKGMEEGAVDIESEMGNFALGEKIKDLKKEQESVAGFYFGAIGDKDANYGSQIYNDAVTALGNEEFNRTLEDRMRRRDPYAGGIGNWLQNKIFTLDARGRTAEQERIDAMSPQELREFNVQRGVLPVGPTHGAYDRKKFEDLEESLGYMYADGGIASLKTK